MVGIPQGGVYLRMGGIYLRVVYLRVYIYLRVWYISGCTYTSGCGIPQGVVYMPPGVCERCTNRVYTSLGEGCTNSGIYLPVCVREACSEEYPSLYVWEACSEEYSLFSLCVKGKQAAKSTPCSPCV